MMTPENKAKLEEMLSRHEGRRLDWYLDTLGNATIGIGHLATKHDDTTQSWTDNQVDMQFQADLQAAIMSIQWPYFNGLDEVRQCALIDQCFNMGWGKLSQFHHMFQALQSQDWQGAHDEAVNSAWSRQVGLRSYEIADMLLTGTWKT